MAIQPERHPAQEPALPSVLAVLSKARTAPSNLATGRAFRRFHARGAKNVISLVSKSTGLLQRQHTELKMIPLGYYGAPLEENLIFR